MNWIGRKIHLYNVTIGLYMLDWWERYLFIGVSPSPPGPAYKEEARSGGGGYVGAGSAMLEVVISIPAIFLVILLALGCYMLGRNRGRAEAQQQFAPPAPPPGLSPK
nr:unnamed protein product [Digitaria exilis]